MKTFDDYELDSIEFNAKPNLKRKKNILSELDEIETETTVLLPSSLYAKPKKEDKKEKEKIEIVKKEDMDTIDDDWMTTLTSFKAPKSSKKSKSVFDGFDIDGKKGKKKKKKKEGQSVSHKKEFEPELALLKNLQMEQSKFVDSLQKKYDQLESTKSTARGVGKFTTDLIVSLTSARSLSMQLVDKIISTKKIVSDLDFKERKEFGAASSSEQQNLSNYASTYLKQVMDAGRNNIVAGNQSNNDYYDSDLGDDIDSLFSSIDESLGDEERSPEAEKYLQYENDNVQVKVVYYEGSQDGESESRYEFVAYDGRGNIIDDYPLPEHSKISINKTTGMATDKYGSKYPIIFM